jgi:hypothetical protein
VKPLTAASVAVSVLAAAAITFVMFHRPGASADPFAGAYPLVTAAPTPSAVPTWRPTGPPAGPLPVFHGQTSPVSGRTVDRASGVSYVRFAPPWKRPGVFSGFHTAGQEFDSKRRDPKHFWYVAVYSGPLPADSDVPGPNRLRAGAELVGRDLVEFIFPDNAVRKEVAGAPMTVDRRPAWVSAFRMFQPPGANRVEKSRTIVVLAVDTGRRRPAIVQISVPDNQNRLLPDINLVIRSLRILR